MMNRIEAVALLTIVSLVGICCSPSKSDDPSKYSDALIVLKGAKELSYGRFRGTDQLSYRITVSYPADREISQIREKLADKGWKPLEEDFLNPGQPSSHVGGWTNFTDDRVKPAREVRQWLAQWESPNKDILSCQLRYSYPAGKKEDMDSLEVRLIFVPAELAIESKRLSQGGDPQDKNADPAK
jgi:hypothetical protein